MHGSCIQWRDPSRFWDLAWFYCWRIWLLASFFHTAAAELTAPHNCFQPMHGETPALCPALFLQMSLLMCVVWSCRVYKLLLPRQPQPSLFPSNNKSFRHRELNPGVTRDRRKYWPPYYSGIEMCLGLDHHNWTVCMFLWGSHVFLGNVLRSLQLSTSTSRSRKQGLASQPWIFNGNVTLR